MTQRPEAGRPQNAGGLAAPNASGSGQPQNARGWGQVPLGVQSGGAPFGTPPFGTPPFGTPPYGTPPYGTPPYRTPPAGAAAPPPFGGRGWDSVSQTWWPAADQRRPGHGRGAGSPGPGTGAPNSAGPYSPGPYSRRPTRYRSTAGSRSGISGIWIAAGVIVVIGLAVVAAPSLNSTPSDDGWNGYVDATTQPLDQGYPWDVTPEPTPIAATQPPVDQLNLILTGSLGAPRAFQTATLLDDGRVLIAGGTDGNAALATAEIYQPLIGSFSPAGQMTTARVYDTATPLPDGRVLIAGGEDADGTPQATAEIFDPETDTFSPTGSMSTPRAHAAAAALPDGRVLIAGGDDGTGPLATVEIFDPATETFSLSGSMFQPRESETATVLGGDQAGKILIAGGKGPSGPISTSETYDPSTGLFGGPDDMGAAREDAVACALPDGGALLVGGYGADQSSESAALLYEPDARWSDPYHVWTATTALADGRTGSAVAPLSNGLVMVAGGMAMDGSLTDSLAIYNPATSAAVGVAELAHGVTGLTATVLGDGSILIVGGENAPHSAVATAELYTSTP